MLQDRENEGWNHSGVVPAFLSYRVSVKRLRPKKWDIYKKNKRSLSVAFFRSYVL